MKVLVVVDMQNDFIDGALGTREAQEIVPYVEDAVKHFDGTVLFTRDTHDEDYLATQEGKNLPVLHCVRGTSGWQIHPSLDALRKTEPIDKVTFGGTGLIDALSRLCAIESVTFLGLCTDICVISNVLLTKAHFPELPVFVDARGCAGVTPESHKTALDAMKACQVTVLHES